MDRTWGWGCVLSWAESKNARWLDSAHATRVSYSIRLYPPAVAMAISGLVGRSPTNVLWTFLPEYSSFVYMGLRDQPHPFS